MNVKSEVGPAQEAHVVERNSICGVRVTLEVDGESFVFITLTSDGSIRRLGIGAPNATEHGILTGTTTPGLFEQIRHKVTPALLQWRGQSWSDPAPRGKTCELEVAFVHADGRETRMHWWYGSESQEPPTEVRDFVLAAVEKTKPWFEQQKAKEQRKNERMNSSWGSFLS